MGTLSRTSISGSTPCIMTCKAASLRSSQPARTRRSRLLVLKMDLATSKSLNPLTSLTRRSLSFGHPSTTIWTALASMCLHQETFNISNWGHDSAMSLKVVLQTAGNPVRLRFTSLLFLLIKSWSVCRCRFRQPSRVALTRFREAFTTISARLWCSNCTHPRRLRSLMNEPAETMIWARASAGIC